jgi:hypothetical protein
MQKDFDDGKDVRIHFSLVTRHSPLCQLMVTITAAMGEEEALAYKESPPSK